MIDFISFIYPSKQRIQKTWNETTITVDGYKEATNAGIMFQTNPSTVKKELVHTCDQHMELDWIFDMTNAYCKQVHIGNYILCETVPEWVEAIQECAQNVFLCTGKQEWIWLADRSTYILECEGKRRTVWIGEACTIREVFQNTCLKTLVPKANRQQLVELCQQTPHVDTLQIAYARCEPSMYKLDTLHREYVNQHEFQTNDIVAIQSVAGSGKTTTLLNLSKIHKQKRILYIAFNKSLITEIKQKVYTQGISNLCPMTFDSLLYQIYLATKKQEPNILTLKPQNVAQYLPWLEGKYYRVKKSIINQFNKFCNNAQVLTMEDYCIHTFGKKKPLLEQLWQQTEKGAFHTFETLRKLAQKQHWFSPYIDKTYDMIMIDETQDFDMSMLRMLLDDTTIPKLFVGDPKQSIYEFRGCINAFLHMPPETLKIEFYSTFRVGNPACQIIRRQFSNCWMVSKSKHTTTLEPFSKWQERAPYTYLFRSWRSLLTAAAEHKAIWINSYEKKAEEIRTLHKKLAFTFLDNEEEFEDDLPKFLKSISDTQLDALLQKIEDNMVEKDVADIKMYTVHSYKGLEDAIVRLSDDIERNEETIYYVALTRGFTRIFTPMDIEYFEKILQAGHVQQDKQGTQEKPKLEPLEVPKVISRPCTCGGCQCPNASLFQFDTSMGKRMWCMECQRYGCSCDRYVVWS